MSSCINLQGLVIKLGHCSSSKKYLSFRGYKSDALLSLDKLGKLRAIASSPTATTLVIPLSKALSYQQSQYCWYCGQELLGAKSRTLWLCWVAPSCVYL